MLVSTCPTSIRNMKVPVKQPTPQLGRPGWLSCSPHADHLPPGGQAKPRRSAYTHPPQAPRETKLGHSSRSTTQGSRVATGHIVYGATLPDRTGYGKSLYAETGAPWGHPDRRGQLPSPGTAAAVRPQVPTSPSATPWSAHPPRLVVIPQVLGSFSSFAAVCPFTPLGRKLTIALVVIHLSARKPPLTLRATINTRCKLDGFDNGYLVNTPLGLKPPR